MQNEETPKTTDELLLALADGELDFADQPQVLAKLAEDPKAAQRLANEQRLKQACAKAMDGPEMKCPDELAGKLLALASGESTSAPSQPAQSVEPAYTGPPVIARIGRWAPTAVAAMILLVAGVLFSQINFVGSGINTEAVTFLTPEQIDRFSGRHFDCAEKPERLNGTDRFGNAGDFEQLPGKLQDYFKSSQNNLALDLNGIGYDYKLTGTCAIPGDGAVQVLYNKRENPDSSMSLWIVPASEKDTAAIEEGRVYVEADGDLMHPVIIWRDGGLLYYLVGDSLEDCDKAVQQLRQAA